MYERARRCPVIAAAGRSRLAYQAMVNVELGRALAVPLSKEAVDGDAEFVGVVVDGPGGDVGEGSALAEAGSGPAPGGVGQHAGAGVLGDGQSAEVGVRGRGGELEAEVLRGLVMSYGDAVRYSAAG